MISAPAIPALSYLRSFPFDKIKIDQSFVRDLAANRDAQAIVRSIISLGIGLGVTITAERRRDRSRTGLPARRGLSRGTGLPVQPSAAQRRDRRAIEAQFGTDCRMDAGVVGKTSLGRLRAEWL